MTDQNTPIINAQTFALATDAIEDAKEVVSQEAPRATFVFKGLNHDRIFFNVVGRASQLTAKEQTELIEKTRFGLIENNTEMQGAVVSLRFFMNIRP